MNFLPATGWSASHDERRPAHGLSSPDGLAHVLGDLLAQTRPPASAVARELNHQPEVTGEHGITHGVNGLQTEKREKEKSH